MSFTEHPRRPHSCNPVIGQKVFAIQYSYPGQKLQWHTVGAWNAKDASDYITEYYSTVSGKKPTIHKVVQHYWNAQTRMWEPKWW